MVSNRFKILVTIAVSLLMLMGGQAVLAQDGTPPDSDGVTDDDVNDIAEELFCPVCENVPLDVCETQACADWREEIRYMLEDGSSEQEIKTYFVDRYGQRVLETPEARGINLIVWFLPPVGVLAGVVVLIMTLRSIAPETLKDEKPVTTSGLTYEGLDPEYVDRIERELQEFAAEMS